MSISHRHALALSIVAACALSACKEPQQPVDFQPEAGQAGTTAAPMAGAPLVNAPAELTYEQRRVAVVAGGRCNLERVNGTKFAGTPVPVSKASPVRFGGWLADADAKAVPSAFDFRLVNTADQRTWKAAGQAGSARPDVQTLLGGDAALAATGYANEFDAAALPDGTYRVYTVFEKGGQVVACDNGRAIVLGP